MNDQEYIAATKIFLLAYKPGDSVKVFRQKIAFEAANMAERVPVARQLVKEIAHTSNANLETIQKRTATLYARLQEEMARLEEGGTDETDTR